MIPFLLLLLLVSNLFLFGQNFYKLLLIVQILFYVGAVGGYLLDKMGKKAKLLALPLYYCVVNAASMAAFFRTILGKKAIVWETLRK